MTRNGLIALCAVAAVTFAGAAVSVYRQPKLQTADVAAAPLFPRLADRLSNLKSIVVTESAGKFTFDWDGKNWTLRERANYPADSEKINGLVVRMARLMKLEPKTRVPDKYVRLDLNDPSAKDSKARQITLIGRDGKPLADLVVGKQKFSLGGKEGGTYVRVPGDPQTWLAMGEIDPGAKAGDWLKKDLVDVKDNQIKSVTVTRPDGEKIVLGKQAPADASFKIENLPRNEMPASDGVADDDGRLLTGLQLEDVAKAADIPFAKDKTTTAVFEGFNGLRVTLDMTEVNGASWIRLAAEAPATATAPKDAKDQPPAPDETKVAADINSRANGWAFQVADYVVAPLKRRMADLIKKPDARTSKPL